MSFNGPLPRAPQYRPSETSRLNSQRDRASLLHSWKNDRSQAGQIDKLNSQVSQSKRQLARLDRQRATGGMHPFKIYNFPSSLRAFRNDDDWRRFKVRGGAVMYVSGQGMQLQGALGTDYGDYLNGNVFENEFVRSEIPPTDNTQISASWHEVAVPADGTRYYFWYSFALAGLLSSGNVHGVLFGSSPVNCKAMETGETITDPNYVNFPNEDPYRRIIGSVKIRTDNAIAPLALAYVPYVEQIRCDHLEFPQSAVVIDGTVFNGESTRIRGTYSSSQYYFVGDMVVQSVTDGNGFTTLNQYVYYPPSTTVYLSTLGPITNIDPSTHTPDPWFLLSSSPTSAGYHIDGSYQAAKGYLRTA